MPLATYHKLLRKKYFEVNDIKAKGNEILNKGDHIKIYLSDDTYDNFVGSKNDKHKGTQTNTNRKGESNRTNRKVICLTSSPVFDRKGESNCTNRKGESNRTNRKGELYEPQNIIYEDEQIILYNKPSGLLSQGDKSGDESVNTILNNYLGTKMKDVAFVPSVVNRLDRNTSGIIIFAKNYVAAREISKMIRDNGITKHYLALVNGVLKKDSDNLVNLLKKDEKTNKSIIKEYKGSVPNGYSKVELIYKVLKRYDDYTLLDIDLITGKSHQIRAQLSYIGHPIVGDKKYMDSDLYNKNFKVYNSKTQKLSCYRIKFGSFNETTLKHLSNKEFKININDFA